MNKFKLLAAILAVSILGGCANGGGSIYPSSGDRAKLTETYDANGNLKREWTCAARGCDGTPTINRNENHNSSVTAVSNANKALKKAEACKKYPTAPSCQE